MRPSSIVLLMAFVGCGGMDDPSPSDDVYTGEQAKSQLFQCDRDQLPTSMTDLWVYDGGSFNGMIYYVSFRCATLEDCWQGIRAFHAPAKTEFIDGIQTKFAVNQHGPSFYAKELEHPQWNISGVKNGVSYEQNWDDRKMDFWAIDLDDLRVYYHYESGGFPDDPPSVRHRRY